MIDIRNKSNSSENYMAYKAIGLHVFYALET